jgi:hypothetical protein
VTNAPGALAQEKERTYGTEVPLSRAPAAGTGEKAARKSSRRVDPRTQELIAILNETQSAETLFVTVKVLEGMGSAAKPAVPAVIRNAERLGLFKGLTRAEGHVRKEKLVEEVVAALLHINEGKRNNGACCYSACPCPVAPCQPMTPVCQPGAVQPCNSPLPVGVPTLAVPAP